ncbi:GNAT family N-acetyltransferase [Paraclostridium bifermentans]|uniref:GNAT family N-acetyltransferase n=1 Tax=Paraclostridium bifermentans TaxID=1490 RepID=UPI00359C7DC4
MNHKGTKRIETERLILRKYTIDDTSDMFKNWGCDEKVTKFLTWENHKGIEDTRKILNMWINEYENIDKYQWAIELKNIKEVVGDITVFNLKNKRFSCEIGYCLSSKFWNSGIMTEALIGVIGYLFDEIGLNRIEARHNVDNIASGKVMIKSNMKYEGTLREAGKMKGENQFYDLAVYSILKSEWKSLKL